MRIRVIRHVEGEIDGVPLHRFQSGHIYDLDASLATYLVVTGDAHVVGDTAPARIRPLTLTPEASHRVKRVIDKAKDRAPKKR